MSHQGNGGFGPVAQMSPESPSLTVPVTSRLAIASFVLGVLAPTFLLGVLAPLTFGITWVFELTWVEFGLRATGMCLVAAVAGLILGSVALWKIDRSRGRTAGHGLARAGVWLSAIFLVAALVAGWMLLLQSAENEARKAKCGSNLKQIGTAASMWLDTHGGTSFFPPSFKAMYDEDIISEPRVFICPGKAKAHEYQEASEFASDYESILDLVDFKIYEAVAGSTVPLAWDKPGNHDDGINVVYFDAHVEFMPGKDAYQRLRTQVDAWIAENKPK